MISRSSRIIGARGVRFLSWNHSKYIKVGVSEVEQHIKENKEWASGADARLITKFVEKLPEKAIDASDMEEYISLRGGQYAWPPPAIRTLSALLTFPLTLSYGLSQIFPAEHKVEALNILVVGARSESSLPMVWWREMLCANSNAATHNIRMVGPGLQQNKSVYGSATTGVAITKSDSNTKKTLSVTNNYTMTADKKLHTDFSALHEHPEHNKLLRWADVFVLFNPGYGNDTLKELWEPTIKQLLHTHKPILCTAYGAHDLKRDLQALDRISTVEDDQEFGEPIEFLFYPQENPFKTFKCTIDPTERGDNGIVTTNHSIYAFLAK